MVLSAINLKRFSEIWDFQLGPGPVDNCQCRILAEKVNALLYLGKLIFLQYWIECGWLWTGSVPFSPRGLFGILRSGKMEPAGPLYNGILSCLLSDPSGLLSPNIKPSVRIHGNPTRSFLNWPPRRPQVVGSWWGTIRWNTPELSIQIIDVSGWGCGVDYNDKTSNASGMVLNKWGYAWQWYDKGA